MKTRRQPVERPFNHDYVDLTVVHRGDCHCYVQLRDRLPADSRHFKVPHMLAIRALSRPVRRVGTPAFLLLLAANALHADQTVKFTVSAGQHDRSNVPINVEFALESSLKDAHAALQDDAGNWYINQLTAPGLFAASAASNDSQGARELHFILPDLKAGQSKQFTLTIPGHAPISDEDGKPGNQFHWRDTPGEYDDLVFNNRPVLRYMYHALDESSKESRFATFKVFHHVFDPVTGNVLLTHTPDPLGYYPHHRGVFYGFYRATYDGNKTCDIWHCPAAFQEHSAFLASEAGPVLGRQLLEINWFAEPKLEKGAKGDEPNALFAKERRQLTAYNIPGGTLIDFASRLTPLLPPLHLDGDPQHSGFHFRAADDVHSKYVKQTYFLRPDGKGPLTEHADMGPQGDETRNWDKDPAKRSPNTVNLPWDAMSFVLGDKRYTVAYLDNSRNPKESRGSERAYGRIGSYFVTDVTPEKPLDVNYRLWVQAGEMTVP